MAPGRREVVWAARARAALEATVAYVAKDSLQSARKVLTDLLAGAASLAEFSERGRFVPELMGTGIRELLVSSYRMIYEVSERRVAIVAVLHQRQDFERWQGSGAGGEPAP